FASEAGRRADNQDFGAIHLGSPGERIHHGIIAAVADGVSGGKAGRIAAELAVQMLIEGYYAMPPTFGPAKAIDRAATAFNAWLWTQGRGEAMASSATTLTAIALRGRRAHIAHVGDSRAWRFAGGRLTCLTSDHVRPEPDMGHVLIRALGIERQLRLDHNVVELAEHDRLLLTSDGVHASLMPLQIAAKLAERGSAESCAEALVVAAIKAGSRDNCTALVIDIVTLPTPDHDGIAASLAHLPVIDPPKVGDRLDGFEIISAFPAGRYTQLFRADDRDGTPVVLKFPLPASFDERAARLAFTNEILIAQRVHSPFVGAAQPIAADRQSALYGVQPFYSGETMAQRLARNLPPLDEAVGHAVRLTRAVAALHRLDIVHRDIKPDNVMLTGPDSLRLIDLGVARLPRIEDFPDALIPGTPGYMAPEQFDGNRGDALTDQFALGVTIYQWLTGKWPYGEQEAFQRPRFGMPVPPFRHRHEIPSWLDAAILTAIQPKPPDRFGDVIELLRALEDGGTVKAEPRPVFVPLLLRDPLRTWQAVSALLAAALLLSLVLR
uniref:protein kinase domain-containing protein n=1 Tax=Sphingomonas sp. TaxID=28214 RepID=UPI00286D4742